MVGVVTPVDAGLGNNSSLLDLGNGRALAVDPSRDLHQPRTPAKDRGLRIAFAADTHLHADFLSGAVELAASDRAQVLAAARTDLIAPERTEDLTRLQYRSLQRLTSLGPAVLTGHLPHLLPSPRRPEPSGPRSPGYAKAADSPGPGRVSPPPRSRRSDHRCTAGRRVRRGASAWLAVDPIAPGLRHLARWLVDPGEPFQASEFTAGQVPGAHHVELGELSPAPMRCRTGRPW
jgi:hypothetical protein